MKTILLIAALGFSASAFAADCTTQDWQVISQALNSKASSGAQYQGQVIGMMAEEMAPRCMNISNPDVVGIPGNQYYTYELISGQRDFVLQIVVGGVEEPGTHLSIVKK